MSAARLVALALVLAATPAPGRAVTAGPPRLAGPMSEAGLERIEPLAGVLGAARGRLPGEGELQVLLFAGCGAEGVAERDAALAAVADLARTPRRHTLELVLCAAPDGGRSADRVARGWLSLHPEIADRDRVLAALHLDMAAAGGGPAGLLPAVGVGPQELRRTPAWLVHIALAGARAAGGQLAFVGRPASLLGQLVAHHGRPRAVSGAAPLLAAGVPALTLAGGDPEDWPVRLAAIVRRLDALAGRPRDDDVYLALAGRVWSRRDLYWAGLVIWVALLAASRPGIWRGAGPHLRRRRGRRYLPGFAFRMLFLVLLLTAPAATLVLLAPAALLTLVPAYRPAVVRTGRVLAAVPALLFAGHWLAAVAAGRLAPWPAQPLRLALTLVGVGLAVSLVGRTRRDGAV